MSRLIHHTLLALSPASHTIHPSNHVPPDFYGMPHATSTHWSHFRSSTDIDPPAMLIPVHRPACTQPWAVSTLQTLDLLGSIQHSGSSSALESPPIQLSLPGWCSDDPVKQSFSCFPALHGLLCPVHHLYTPRLRHAWLPMTIGDSLIDPECTPVRPFGLGGPCLLLTPPPPPDGCSAILDSYYRL
jgi:hypothetical protein